MSGRRDRRAAVFLAPKGNRRSATSAADGVLAGLTRCIGSTGHARPERWGRALRRHRLDTVLAALGVTERLATRPETFLSPEAGARGIGMIAMNVLGHGTLTAREAAWGDAPGVSGVSLAIVGMKSPVEIAALVEYGARCRPRTAAELAGLSAEVRPLVERDAPKSARQGQGALPADRYAAAESAGARRPDPRGIPRVVLRTARDRASGPWCCVHPA